MDSYKRRSYLWNPPLENLRRRTVNFENQAKGQFGGVKDVRPYESNDFRFTTKGEVLYAFCMSKLAGDIKLRHLANKPR